MYTFPSATINNMTFTAKRWGQFPTITYNITDVSIVAGSERVVLASDLSNITVFIQDMASTNLQIQTAILAARGTAVDSLYASDLVSTSIAMGHSSDTNTAVSATSLSGASETPPSAPNSISYDPGFIRKDGSVAFAAAESMASHKLTSVSTPTASSDAATKGYVDGLVPGLNVIKIVSADPMTPTEGQVWYNSTSHLLKYYDGTSVKTVTAS